MSDALSIAIDPALPRALLIALGAAALATCGYAAWRRARGAWLRALAAALVTAALVNPTLLQEQRAPLDDVAIVLIDDSASARIGARPALAEQALASLRDDLAAIDGLDVREVHVGGGGAGADDEGTRLFSALEGALADVPAGRLAGVIAVTDGQAHDAERWASGQLAIDAPAHALITGARNEADRRLVIAESPGFGIVGRDQTVVVRVEDEAMPDGAAQVTLRYDGAPLDSATLPIGQPFAVTIPIEHAGANVFELEVEQGPSELTLINNQAVISVNGVRDRLRVLLVSGEPHAGERTWRDLLKSDPAVDLIHFTILRPPEKNDNTPVSELSLISFPVRELFELRIDDFDLIIFDRYRRRNVLPPAYLQNIADYVANGGAFLEAVGPTFATPLSLNYTPLGDILPGTPSGLVFEQGYRAEVTDIGRRHPVTSNLPGADGGEDGAPAWGRWFRQIDVEAVSGAVVMTGVDGRPLLILDRVGEGRVAQLMTDQLWLWARGFEGGGPQQELLRRIAHWLMREPALEEDVLSAEARGGRLEIARRTLEDDASPVVVTRPDGATVEVILGPADENGVARGALPAQSAGLYRLNDGARSALAAVGGLNPIEFRDVTASAAALGPVADATGGDTVWLAEDDPPAVRMVEPGRAARGRGWIGLVRNGGYVVTGVTKIPLLPGLAMLVLALGAAIAAWRREGR